MLLHAVLYQVSYWRVMQLPHISEHIKYKENLYTYPSIYLSIYLSLYIYVCLIYGSAALCWTLAPFSVS
jgi:hypothetical protein